MAIHIDDVIFNVEEAAEFARVTPTCIRRWFDEGLKHFPTVSKVARTGPRREIIRKSVLLEFIEAREVGVLASSLEPAKEKQPRVVRSTFDPNGLMTKKPRSVPATTPGDPNSFRTDKSRRSR